MSANAGLIQDSVALGEIFSMSSLSSANSHSTDFSKVIIIIIIRDWYNGQNSGLHTKWTSRPTPKEKKII
jgi:hypothetical protein